jgi:hypothetical protein
MFNRFLRRLPDEFNKATYYPFNETTQTHENTGELFYFAFETNEVNGTFTVLRQIFSDATGPVIISTSSDIDFKVGDQIEFDGKVKLITDTALLYLENDILRSVDFRPNANLYYKRLSLS